jgi:hypothetical protein
VHECFIQASHSVLAAFEVEIRLPIEVLDFTPRYILEER